MSPRLSLASSANATVRDRDTLVRPPEYTDWVLIDTMYQKEIHLGFDASIICHGDIVFCAQGKEKGIYTIDCWCGSYPLKFHTGTLSIAPICQTVSYWFKSEYLFAHNLILLSGGESHPNHMGPVAKTLARLCRKWKQQRTREGEPEAKRRRRSWIVPDPSDR